MYTTKEGKQYICYSKCGDGQKLEIREMINPYTFGDKRAIISEPIYDWEMVGPYHRRINEGAFFVENEGKLFILYSYNGCYSDDYGLAVLEYLGGEMCDAASWKKYDHPTFTKGNGVYGPGHATFFRSPDGTEVWICYHCLETSSPEEEGRHRFMNIQKIEFDEDGRMICVHIRTLDPDVNEITIENLNSQCKSVTLNVLNDNLQPEFDSVRIEKQ
jgi:GH43 family beta-xylosidase